MIVRKDATDNFAATEDDDFDALLNASSLGAPHVVAETEPIPADIRRRLSQAAARPARREATPPTSKEADCAPGNFHGRLSTHFDDALRKLRESIMVVLVGQASSGKTALLRSLLLSELADPRPTACSAASPTWRQKAWQRALQDCGHLAWEPWASFSMGDVEPTPWPVGGGGSRCGALLLGSFSRNTFCTPYAGLPLYGRDNPPASQTPRRVLRPAQMTDLLSLGHAAPTAPALLPWPESRQEAPQRRLVLLDCCSHTTSQLRPAWEPFPSWPQQPVWRGAEYGHLLALPSSDVLSRLYGFPPGPVDLHTYGRYLPPPLPCAGTRHWRDLMPRGEAWPLRADDELPDGYRDSCWRQDKAVNTSQSRDPILVYFAGHGLSAACTRWRREPAETWPELMWSEHVDDGAIEHAVMPMIVHQKKGGKQAEVPVRVTYRSGDPYAVEAVFYRGDPGDEVVWCFARDLLVEGLQHSGGEGDVTVWTPPDPPTRHAERRTFIQLSSPEGKALLSASHAQLKRFVDKTLFLVAAGTEHQRFGGTLDRLESELGELTCPGFGD
ncbi:SsgA family sporulation/cell division regulator [Streptomyces sp. NPDC001492]